MISKIKTFFDNKFSSSENNSINIDEKMNLAAAALLIEVAYSDNDIADIEKDTLKSLLLSEFNLEQGTIDELVILAEEEVREANSSYEFTRLINKFFESEQKFNLVKAMWEIAYADGNLDRYEESMIRKLADLLYVSHSDFIRAKLQVQESN